MLGEIAFVCGLLLIPSILVFLIEPGFSLGEKRVRIRRGLIFFILVPVSALLMGLGLLSSRFSGEPEKKFDVHAAPMNHAVSSTQMQITDPAAEFSNQTQKKREQPAENSDSPEDQPNPAVDDGE